MADAKPSVFRRRPQQSRSQARVEAILQAAAEVFWEMGYDAATTHAIAKRANTAVGTLYRFFPNKLALFHALEKEHRLSVESLHAELMTPEFMQQSLSAMIRQMVETFADYFEALGPRVVYVQYFVAPEMFVHFDDTVDYGFIQRFAIALRMCNKSLSVPKSELIAEICHRSFNAILLSALRSSPEHRAQLYLELQALLINYLSPYMPQSMPQLLAVGGTDLHAPQLSVNSRQQIALAYLRQHGTLTIQTFEQLCPERSRRTLQRDLKQLIQKGIVRTEGDTTQLTYRLVT
ncbi:MAG: TetR family transcriptional regulator [Phormidesmis sp.]